jgi:hypothetical protein
VGLTDEERHEVVLVMGEVMAQHVVHERAPSCSR